MLAELKNQPEAIKKFLQVCFGFRVVLRVEGLGPCLHL
jgi:hypothetical protein